MSVVRPRTRTERKDFKFWKLPNTPCDCRVPASHNCCLSCSRSTAAAAAATAGVGASGSDDHTETLSTICLAHVSCCCCSLLRQRPLQPTYHSLTLSRSLSPRPPPSTLCSLPLVVTSCPSVSCCAKLLQPPLRRVLTSHHVAVEPLIISPFPRLVVLRAESLTALDGREPEPA